VGIPVPFPEKLRSFLIATGLSMDWLASAVSTSGPVCIDLVQSQLLLDNVEYRERQLIACEENDLCSRVHSPYIYRHGSWRGTRRNRRRTGEFIRGKGQVKYQWQRLGTFLSTGLHHVSV